MHRRLFHRLILLAIVSGLLAACNQATAEPTPTVEPMPTATPTGELPWWNDRVFYEIFVRSFYDSDGDGTGDLQGVIEKLDYLNDGDPDGGDDLGITGIWLMPVMQSPSYHGYDVIDYTTIEEDYGTNEDFLRLIEEAHNRDIVVIVDLVLNHTSIEHPWFEASRQGDPDYADFYIWQDENPGYNGPWSQQVWHELDGRFYYGVFWDGMPDLNYRNPAVTEQMESVTRFWLEEMGADGFRLDAIKHLIENGAIQENTPDTLDWFTGYDDFIDSIDPDALTVGEVWSATSDVVKYVDGRVDIAFEFNLAEAFITAAQRRNNKLAYRGLSDVLAAYPDGQYATFLANHDQYRVMSQLLGDDEAGKVAATMLLTAPGVPFIYYGEEVGMLGEKPDERIRTPMQWAGGETGGFTTGTPWEALSDEVDTRNVAVEEADPDSLLNHYRRLIGLRNAYEAMRVGDTYLVESDHDAVYAILRYVEGEAVLVVVNLAVEPVGDYGLTLSAGPLGAVSNVEALLGEGELVVPDVTPGGGFSYYRPLPELPARGSLILLLGE